ncbi:MAG: undecaprenyl-diphosphate phosphatase [Clostridia bacterium]|nr:undecaprenyl-diphosphate phosphatase [Clostridia bacterium]
MNVVEILKAMLFGVVEGVTEWLPVSSTGHMILLNELMPLKVSESFYSLYEVVIQLGAIMAVLAVFWDEVWPFGRRNNPQPAGETGLLAWVKLDKIRLWLKIALACVPAAVVGILFDDVFDRLFHNYVCVSVALIVFGVAFILVERMREGRRPAIRSLEALDWRTVALIGLFQLLAAIFPGTSRSGATIVGALMLGVSRAVAVEFTFYLAIPVMFGASLIKLLKYDAFITRGEFVLLAVGMLTAYVVSALVVRRLLAYIKKHDFKPFGWYRIALGIVVLAFFTIRSMG